MVGYQRLELREGRMEVYEHLFRPIRIGRMVVKNRIEAAPAMPMLASGDCDVSIELVEWYRSIAKGGAGIVTVGDSPIVGEVAQRVGHVLNLASDKIINGLNRLAETIKAYGAKASIELSYHIPHSHRSPTDLSLEEIRSLIEAHVKAAYRCLAAGMDMIMIHGAHGHMISQFLSPRRNLRTDQYGGSFSNRMRFILELLDAIRQKVGDDLAIEYRISGSELTPFGLTLEEQLEFAGLIQDKIDLIHVSAGMLYEDETVPRMIQPTYLPRGVNVPYAERFKKELRIPVAAVGSIDMSLAEKILKEGKADVVAMARTLIADPDGPEKVRIGEAERPCVRCNSCIHRTHMFFLPARCAVNPLAGREAEYKSAFLVGARKRVVVIGGGPAGMEAARVAARKGHEVVLFEKEKELGGALRLASYPPFKEDMKRYLEWAVRETLRTENIIVKLSEEATVELVRSYGPDALIVAVGAEPIVPEIEGLEEAGFLSIRDIYFGEAKVGETVVVLGAGLSGSEAALFLAQKGVKVTIVDLLPIQKIDSEYPFINILCLRSMLKEKGVETIEEVKPLRLKGGCLTLIDRNFQKRELPCGTLVVAAGSRPKGDVVEQFRSLAKYVRAIGDCNNERGNLYKAIHEGFFAAIDL